MIFLFYFLFEKFKIKFIKREKKIDIRQQKIGYGAVITFPKRINAAIEPLSDIWNAHCKPTNNQISRIFVFQS